MLHSHLPPVDPRPPPHSLHPGQCGFVLINHVVRSQAFCAPVICTGSTSSANPDQDQALSSCPAPGLCYQTLKVCWIMNSRRGLELFSLYSLLEKKCTHAWGLCKMLIKASSPYFSLVKPILTYSFLLSTTSSQPGPSVLLGVTINTCWAFIMYQAPLKIFTYVHSVNPHNKPTWWRLLSMPLHKREKSATERISNHCKVMQLVSGRAVIWTPAAWLQSSPTPRSWLCLSLVGDEFFLDHWGGPENCLILLGLGVGSRDTKHVCGGGDL